VSLSVNLGFRLSFENRYLLVTIVRVQRNLCAGRETGQAGGNVFCPYLFRYKRNGLNAVATVNHRQRIDSQNVRFWHGKTSSAVL
jgi:hypothetical protein